MTAISRVIILAALLSVGVPAFAQKSADPKSIPDSLDYVKDIRVTGRAGAKSWRRF